MELIRSEFASVAAFMYRELYSCVEVQNKKLGTAAPLFVVTCIDSDSYSFISQASRACLVCKSTLYICARTAAQYHL